METFVIRDYTVTDKDWLVERHQTLYREAEGFDDSFGPLVATILDDFAAHRGPQDRGWIATRGGVPSGSIFCVDAGGGMAKLRLFLVLPKARGTGIAGQLLDTCLSHARTAGYAGMTLWTHQSHVAAGRIYTRAGFTCVSEKPVRNFGVDLVEQSWQIAF